MRAEQSLRAFSLQLSRGVRSHAKVSKERWSVRTLVRACLVAGSRLLSVSFLVFMLLSALFLCAVLKAGSQGMRKLEKVRA